MGQQINRTKHVARAFSDDYCPEPVESSSWTHKFSAKTHQRSAPGKSHTPQTMETLICLQDVQRPISYPIGDVGIRTTRHLAAKQLDAKGSKHEHEDHQQGRDEEDLLEATAQFYHDFPHVRNEDENAQRT